MQFAASSDHPADTARVAALLSDESFLAARAEIAGATEREVSVDRDGEAFTSTTTMTMPSTMVPPAFRSLVGQSLHLRLVEDWTAPEGDGGRASGLSLEIRGVPVRVMGTQRLEAVDGSSRLTYEGEVHASVPIVGRSIEKAAVQAVEEIVEVERRLIHDRLTVG